LETNPSPSSRKQPLHRRWLELPPANITLADPVRASGPVSQLKKARPCCTGLVSGATLQSFFPLAGGLGEIQQAGFYADPMCAPGHWCVRLYHRTATDALGMTLPTFFSRCGRAGTGRCTGFWDAAQILTRTKMQVRKQVALFAFPLAGPDQPVSFLLLFHEEKWRCLMETR
jgi:hypothetical protein